METQRTFKTWVACLLVGGHFLGLALWLESFLHQHLWPLSDQTLAPFPLGWLVVAGLLTGGLLGWIAPYYPALEGFLLSLLVPLRLLMRDNFSVGLYNLPEILLKYELGFVTLFLGAFAVFLMRGTGLATPVFLGLRYLRFKLISAISVAGVALGVAAMIVVLSVMSGFELELQNKIIGTNAHAMVIKRGTEFHDYRTQLEKLRNLPGLVGASPFVYNEGMVSSVTNLSGVFIRGVEVDSINAVTDLDRALNGRGSLDFLTHPERIRAAHAATQDPAESPASARPTASLASEGAAAIEAQDVPPPKPLFSGPPSDRTLPGVLIGDKLQKALRVELGDRVKIISPLSDEIGPSGPLPKIRSFRVAGVFATGMYEYDAKSVVLSLAEAQRFFGMGDTVTSLLLRFDDVRKVDERCEQVLQALDGSPFFTLTWFQMNRNVFTAFKMQKIVMFILMVIITFVSAFGIISTLIMLVWEKVKEIAILKSMGATGDGVMKIFITQGLTIGLAGTILGVLLGLGVCLLLQQVPFQIDPEVYYIDRLPVMLDPLQIAAIAGIALHISFIATLLPAGRALKLKPVDGLRYE